MRNANVSSSVSVVLASSRLLMCTDPFRMLSWLRVLWLLVMAMSLTLALAGSVTAANNPPTATDDSVSTFQDTPLSFLASDLTLNDSPGAGASTLTVTSVDTVSQFGGTVFFTNGTVIYIPPTAGFTGADSFHYTVCDDGNPLACTTTGKVNVTVMAPTAFHTITVNSLVDALTDSGNCTLRAAITNANNNQSGSTACATGVGDTRITFVVSGTLTLNSPLPAIAAASTAGRLIIDGSTQTITLSGDNTTRVMETLDGADLTLIGLTISRGMGRTEPHLGQHGGELLGGGLLVRSGSRVTITDSTFANNNTSATAVGGALFLMNDSTVTIASSTFVNNTASVGGGAIYSDGRNDQPSFKVLTIINSTFSGNTQQNAPGALFLCAGAVYNDVGSRATIINSTFSGNSSSACPTIFSHRGDDAPMKFFNTIIADSIVGGRNCFSFYDGQGNPQTANITGSNNLSGDSSCGSAFSSADPQLGPLANNGGSTRTMTLQSGSPAIDAGTDAFCPPTDQRGTYRPHGVHCDIGAVEPDTVVTVTSNHAASVFGQSVTFTATVSAIPPGTGTPTGTVTFKDGTTTLSEAPSTLNASGVARLSTADLAVGSHAITAEYDGDSSFNPNTSSVLLQVVSPLVIPPPTVDVPFVGVFDAEGIQDTVQTLQVIGNDHPEVVTATVVGTVLTLAAQPGQTGSALITVRVTGTAGHVVDKSFSVTVTQVSGAPVVVVDPTFSIDNLLLNYLPATLNTDLDLTPYFAAMAANAGPLTLTVSGNTAPTLVTATPMVGTLRLHLTLAPQGTATLTVRATDSTAASMQTSFKMCWDLKDSDGDGIGDACDTDADNDGVLDKASFAGGFSAIPTSAGGDNCPLQFNPAQEHSSGASTLLGDACNPDVDGDGYARVDYRVKRPSYTGECCVNSAVAYKVDARTGEITDSRPCVQGSCTPVPLSTGVTYYEVRGGDCDDAAPAVYPGQPGCLGPPHPGATEGPPTDPAVLAALAASTADADGDGVSDNADNCPNTFNPPTNWTDKNGGYHFNTQPDFDLGGTGDACDIDEDGDGVPDKVAGATPGVFTPKPVSAGGDNCPHTPNADQLKTSQSPQTLGDACNPDVDGDGYAKPNYGVKSPSYTGECCTNPDVAYAVKATTGEIIGSRGCLRASCTPVALGTNAVYPGTNIVYYEVRGGDCDDTNLNVNPGKTEIPGNSLDDDCNPATPDGNFDIAFDFTGTMVNTSDPIPSIITYDNWLPTDGGQATITARVVSPNSFSSASFTISVVDVTHYPGKYTNDASTDDSSDYTFQINGNQISLTSLDYGGSITLQVNATVLDLAQHPTQLQKTITLPKGPVTTQTGSGVTTYTYELPDAWVQRYAPQALTRDGDNDTSVHQCDTCSGDGLKNIKEYRGFKWGQLVVSSDPKYYTRAYVPDPANRVVHFRGNPLRKDLFIKFQNYDTPRYAVPTTSYTNPNNSQPCDCPFALGEAYNTAEIDVHAMSVDESTTPTTTDPGEQNIDVVVIKNQLSIVYEPFPATGHTAIPSPRPGPRTWQWAVKGYTASIGTGTQYGSISTYQKSLDFYISDKPYTDNNTAHQVLWPLSTGPTTDIEDANDNGKLDTTSPTEDKLKGTGHTGVLDGPYYKPNTYNNKFTVFDVDNNGKVELPIVATITPLTPQYTKAQVLKQTISHELGHALGIMTNPSTSPINHTTDPNDLMYFSTNDWKRDGYISDTAKGAIRIHNQ